MIRSVRSSIRGKGASFLRVRAGSSRLLITLILSTTALVAASFPLARAASPALPSRPNIVFILTDDQRWDEMQYMPIVQSQLRANGVTFSNGFVSNPLCCPARATILTGRYSGHNGVWSNRQKDFGGWPTFRDLGDENHTIATVLHSAGYHTGLIGKYMNEYDDPSWVPVGWDTWDALTKLDYYGPTESVQGSEVTFPDYQYQTDVIGQQAVNFIHDAPDGQPLFLYWAPHAPHLPSTPLASDKGSLASSLHPWRPPSYNEASVSDKPWYIQREPLWPTSKQQHWDQVREDMYESLIDVDRWIGNILNALQSEGRLSNTLLVFTSDNGFMLGEHRRTGKVVPYEESIRVPWVVRWDAAGFPERGGSDSHLMLNTDFATTFAHVAGTSMGDTDGLDFAALAASPSSSWRTNFLIEHGGTTNGHGATGLTYCGVRTQNYTYAQYWNGFEELYDLNRDPGELTNVASQYQYHNVLDAERNYTHDLCDPVPPDFTWSH
jgi:N-acetylglucosamine-6-sulfatase